MPSEACEEELETLSAIFLHEIDIKDETPEGETQISMILYPATADDEESQYVTLTLELTLPQNYPKRPPIILFRNPRGLNDTMLEDLMITMKARCEDRLDSQMIYELVDMCKEFLTKNNRPASECPICLFLFTEFDVFYRTRCFHHFHSQCLGNYLKNLATSFKEEENVLKEKQELTCPVCRERLEDGINIEKLVESPPPSEELESNEGDTPPKVLQDWEGRKKAMMKLYEKQKSQGGIIDLTENKKMLVISSPGERDNESQGGASNNVSNSNAATGNDSIPQQGRDQRSGRQKFKGPPNLHGNSSNSAGSHRGSQNSSVDNTSGSSSKSSSKSVKDSEDCQNGGRDNEAVFPDSRHSHVRHRRGGGYNNRRRNK